MPFYLDVFLSPVRDSLVAQAALVALLALILLDWVFGIGNALMKGEFSSRKMREGIGHKCSELGFVLVGLIMDGLLFAGLDVGFSGPILVAVAAYLCLMEVGSLLETFVKINPQLADSPVFRLLSSVHMVDGGEHDEP